MKKSRFTESQIVEILKEGDSGAPVAEVARKHGISRACYFKWRSKYGGVTVNELISGDFSARCAGVVSQPL